MLLELASELQVKGPLSPAELPPTEWRSLWQRCPRASVFQSPAWIHAWWARFGGAHPWMLAFYHAQRLVGIVPLFLWPEERRVLLMGTGITDSLDMLAEDQWAPNVAEATFQWLDSCHSEWDVCDLQQLPHDSPLRTAPIPQQWEDSLIAQDTAPVLKLPFHEDDTPRRTELAYLRRRLEKEGEVEIVAATEENFCDLFTALLELHGARWADRAETGVLSDESVQEFHLDAAHGLLRLGALRLFVLKVAGQPVAAYYGFQHAGRAVYYLGGFAPEWKHFSVGTLIIGHAIAEAMREGAREFDFGRGREPYKYRWGAEDRFTCRRELHA